MGHSETVGRIVDIGCHRPPPVLACKCREIVMEHKRAHDAARSFAEEAVANKALWDAFGVEE